MHRRTYERHPYTEPSQNADLLQTDLSPSFLTSATESPRMSQESNDDGNSYAFDELAHCQLFEVMEGNVSVHDWCNDPGDRLLVEARSGVREIHSSEPTLETRTSELLGANLRESNETIQKQAALSIDMGTRFHESNIDAAVAGRPRKARPSRQAAKRKRYDNDDDTSVTTNGSEASWKEHSKQTKGADVVPKRKRVRKKYKPDNIVLVDFNKHDILCQRGGLANTHEGNLRYHDVKTSLQPEYAKRTKEKKGEIARQLVNSVHAWGGRFLEHDKDSNRWFEIHYKKACIKASQALRENYTKAERAAKRAKYREKKKKIEAMKTAAV